MFSLKLKEFLIEGPTLNKAKQLESTDGLQLQDLPRNDTNNRKTTLEVVQSGSIEILEEWDRMLFDEKSIQTEFINGLNQVDLFRDRIENSGLHEKLLKHFEIKTKIEILTLTDTLLKLHHFSNVKRIPELVFGVINSLPKTLPEGSRIRQKMNETVEMVKASLLQSFHAEFEAHLSENKNSNDAKVMWTSFLNVAKDWLSAYSLVSLLPVLISNSLSLILERYVDALDEAMTPLWGRFHFHLTTARESRSVEQLVWTFNYAKSFVTLLIDLCSQLTSSGKLERLHKVDFEGAAIIHIVDKAVRFMRAHLAQSIVDYSPMDDIVCAKVNKSL